MGSAQCFMFFCCSDDSDYVFLPVALPPNELFCFDHLRIRNHISSMFERDADGRLKRIEYRGKYLRASRINLIGTYEVGQPCANPVNRLDHGLRSCPPGFSVKSVTLFTRQFSENLLVQSPSVAAG